MTQNTQHSEQKPQQQDAKPQVERKPNEHLGIVFSETLTIRDPNTGEILLQQRCS